MHIEDYLRYYIINLYIFLFSPLSLRHLVQAGLTRTPQASHESQHPSGDRLAGARCRAGGHPVLPLLGAWRPCASHRWPRRVAWNAVPSGYGWGGDDPWQRAVRDVGETVTKRLPTDLHFGCLSQCWCFGSSFHFHWNARKYQEGDDWWSHSDASQGHSSF